MTGINRKISSRNRKNKRRYYGREEGNEMEKEGSLTHGQGSTGKE
jgi:hypothetical protein